MSVPHTCLGSCGQERRLELAPASDLDEVAERLDQLTREIAALRTALARFVEEAQPRATWTVRAAAHADHFAIAPQTARPASNQPPVIVVERDRRISTLRTVAFVAPIEGHERARWQALRTRAQLALITTVEGGMRAEGLEPPWA
jgi:hypothetical protein